MWANSLCFRDPKDPGETRVTWVITVREDRKDTEDSLVCRVFLDLRYVQPTHIHTHTLCKWQCIKLMKHICTRT